MALSITLSPGYTFQTDGTDKVTFGKLNQLGSPMVSISGTVGSSEIEDGSVTTAKIAADAINGTKIANGAIGVEHLGSADQGTIFYRGASTWNHLAPGTSGQVLTTKGASDNPEWATVPSVSTVSPSNISAGSNSTYLVTNASGTVEWAAQASTKIAVFWEEQTNGTDGGTFTQDTNVTRVLNQSTDPGSIATLSSNRITLQAGSYLVEASAPGFDCDTHVVWLYDTTNSTTLIDGEATYSDNSSAQAVRANLSGIFTLSAAADLELRHRCTSSRSTDGLGNAAGSLGGDTSHPEIYSMVKIIKLV
jgi:hypothetical protein